MRWGMVINLVKCTRCHACVAACRVEHFLPLRVTWPRLIAFETEIGGQVERLHVPGAVQPVQRRPLRQGLPHGGHPAAGGRHRLDRPRQVHRVPLLRGRLPLPEPRPSFPRTRIPATSPGTKRPLREEG